MVYFMSNYPH